MRKVVGQETTRQEILNVPVSTLIIELKLEIARVIQKMRLPTHHSTTANQDASTLSHLCKAVQLVYALEKMDQIDVKTMTNEELKNTAMRLISGLN